MTAVLPGEALTVYLALEKIALAINTDTPHGRAVLYAMDLVFETLLPHERAYLNGRGL